MKSLPNNSFDSFTIAFSIRSAKIETAATTATERHNEIKIVLSSPARKALRSIFNESISIF
jgi:hypothetical protein